MKQIKYVTMNVYTVIPYILAWTTAGSNETLANQHQVGLFFAIRSNCQMAIWNCEGKSQVSIDKYSSLCQV